MTMKCEKTNIRECAIKICEARIKHLQNAPPHYHGKRQRLREIELEKVKIAALTLTPPNEPLRCTGCMYLDADFVPCVHCVRAAGYADYYRRPPEGEEIHDKS